MSPAGRYEVGRSLLNLDPSGITRINIIADNFGGELVADVVLAVVAADLGIETVIHVKQLPMFVSDVTTDDITILFDRIGKKVVTTEAGQLFLAFAARALKEVDAGIAMLQPAADGLTGAVREVDTVARLGGWPAREFLLVRPMGVRRGCSRTPLDRTSSAPPATIAPSWSPRCSKR